VELRPQIKPFMFPIVQPSGRPGLWPEWGAVELWQALEAALEGEGKPVG
jgi:hypothetical protein